jgi:very-short-patch-repair endonuclease
MADRDCRNQSPQAAQQSPPACGGRVATIPRKRGKGRNNPLPRLRGRARAGATACTMCDRDQKPKWRVSEKLRGNARALRCDMTDAERIIWYNLRAHRLEGAGFRRQVPIGPYIADFVCHAAKLIVEVDGGQHFESQNIERDLQRDEYLLARGFRVLRFTNAGVMTNRFGVLEAILAAVGKSPLPNPPPQAGEGIAAAPERTTRSHEKIASSLGRTGTSPERAAAPPEQTAPSSERIGGSSEQGRLDHRRQMASLGREAGS